MIVHSGGIEIKISSNKILTMKSKLFLIGLIVILFMVNANAQWNWPDDKATAEEKNALYTDSYKQGNYRAAANHLYWLLVNAPDLNKSIYINGVNIYYEINLLISCKNFFLIFKLLALFL